MNVKVLAPAKINLGLEILGKRTDGYHNVDMVMQSVSLYDVLDVSVSKENSFDIKSNVDFGCPLEDNIIYKAAEHFFRFTGIKNTGICIKIQKNIPSCAGLAGGSSDGAAAILAFDKLFGTGLSQNDLMNICARVGSDVPFCMLGGTARSSGRGTELTPINSKPQYNLVIVKPDVDISTKSAYAKADNIKEKNITAIDKISFALQNGNLLEVCDNLFNRFENIADNLEISLLKNKMIDLGAKGSLMTGSGSAVFGIFEDSNLAQKCLEFMRKDYKQIFLCKPTRSGAIIDD